MSLILCRLSILTTETGQGASQRCYFSLPEQRRKKKKKKKKAKARVGPHDWLDQKCHYLDGALVRVCPVIRWALGGSAD